MFKAAKQRFEQQVFINIEFMIGLAHNQFGSASGCAFVPHEANLAITSPSVSAHSDARHTKLYMNIVDDREDSDVGRRGAGIAASKVKAEGLIQKFVTTVEEGFRAKGYILTTSKADANAELMVALRTLKFEESAGFFTVGAEADAAIYANAEKGSEDYRQYYRASDEDRQLAISFGSGIDAQLSQVLKEALTKLFNDQQLDNFLTGRSALSAID